LEPSEIVGKFGFTTLALVQVASPERDHSANMLTAATTSSTNSGKAVDALNVETGSIIQPTPVLESTDFHSFTGFLLHKVRPKTEIILGKFSTP